MLLLLLDPPYVIGPPLITSVTAGDNVTIQCIANGFPLPDIVWFKNINTQLYSTPYMVITHETNQTINTVTSSLSLLQVTEEDTGLYVCIANNTLVEDRVANGPNGALYILCKLLEYL